MPTLQFRHWAVHLARGRAASSCAPVEETVASDLAGSALLEALEARVLFSADLLPVAEPDYPELTENLLTSPPPMAVDETVELVLINDNIENHPDLLRDLREQQTHGRALVWHVLSGESSGLAQIATLLSRYDSISALHVISDSDASGVQLGGSRLAADSLVDYVHDLAASAGQPDTGLEVFHYAGNDAVSHDFTTGAVDSAGAASSVSQTAGLPAASVLHYSPTAVPVSAALEDEWLGALAAYPEQPADTVLALDDQASGAPDGITHGVAINTDAGNDSYFEIPLSVTQGLYSHTIQTRFVTDDVSNLVIMPWFNTYFRLYLTDDMADGQPHTHTWSWNSETGTLSSYIDNELLWELQRNFAIGWPLITSQPLVIGQDYYPDTQIFNPSQAFSGTVFDVRIWDYALSHGEIADNLQNQISHTSPPASILANWRFDGIVGASADRIEDDVNPGVNDILIKKTGSIGSTPSAQITIDDDPADGQSIGYLHASDPEGLDQTLAFSLIDDAGGGFSVDANSGELFIADGDIIEAGVEASVVPIEVRVTDDTGQFVDRQLDIAINPVNEAPTMYGFASPDPIFHPDEDPVPLGPLLVPGDPELSQRDNFNGFEIFLHRVGGPNINDEFELGSYAVGTSLYTPDTGSTSIGTVTNGFGLLYMHFNGAATANAVRDVVRAIAYRTDSEVSALTTIDLEWTLKDHNPVTYQGGGAAQVSTYTSGVLIAPAGYLAVDDDLGEVLSGAPLSIPAASLTANDLDTQGSTPTIVSATTPTHGSVSPTADGLQYSSVAGVTGPVNFDYLAMSGDASMISQWQLDQNGVDDSGRNSGVVHGDIGAPGESIFDGDTYVEIPNFDYPDHFTLTFDFKINNLENSDEEVLFAQGAWKAENSLHVWIIGSEYGDNNLDGKLITDIWDSTDAGAGYDGYLFTLDIAELNLDDHQWHNYAVVLEEGVGATVYIDGLPRHTSSTRGDGPFEPTEPAYFGAEETNVKKDEFDYFLKDYEIADARLLEGFDLDAIAVNQLNQFSSANVSLTLYNHTAPTLGNGILDPILEDAVDPVGNTIATIFAGQYVDADNDFSGIAIAADATTTEGQWQYSTDSGTNWFDIDTVGTASALALDVTALLRFQPAGDFNGAVPELAIHAIDDSYSGEYSDFADRKLIDVTVRGGSSAFSQVAATIVTSVNAMNDAPTLTSASLVDIDEDSNGGAGQALSEIFSGQFNDVDGTFTAVAVVSDSTNAGGRWQYSINSGVDWYNIGPVSSASAMVFNLDTLLRYVPAEDFYGVVHQLGVVGIDDTYTGGFTDGTNHITADVLLRGGTTAYSLSMAGVNLSVANVNDLPVLTDGILANILRNESSPTGDEIGEIFAGQFSDIDSDFDGVAITGDTTTTEGSWQYSTNSGASWHNLGSVSVSAAVHLKHLSMLRFLPSTDYTGDVPELTVYAIDSSYSGSYTSDGARVTKDLGVRADGSPYALLPATVHSAVLADGPVDLSSGITLNAEEGNSSYFVADSGNAVFGGRASFTLESQFAIASASDKNVLISYATYSNPNEVLLYIDSDGTIFLQVAGASASTGIGYEQLLDGDWHSVAVSWDSANGDVAFFIDGHRVHGAGSVAHGDTVQEDGSLVVGQQQGVFAGGFSPAHAFHGTLYDMRVWNEVRTSVEILHNFKHKLESASLPLTLVANWQMDGFGTSGEVVDTVTGNHLRKMLATEDGFVNSMMRSEFQVSEADENGTIIGTLVPGTQFPVDDLVTDGGFTWSGDNNSTLYSADTRIGGAGGFWSVDSGSIDVIGDWPETPLGGTAVDLDGWEPGAISQVLSTEVGKTYQLNFNLSGNFGVLASKHLSVNITGSGAVNTTEFSVDPMVGWSSSSPFWQPSSITFVADSALTTLGFESLSTGGDSGALVADVRVVEVDAGVAALLAANPSVSYNASTGKFYQAVATTAHWHEARAAAIAEQLNGVPGQLVTIGSASENGVVQALAQSISGPIWLGASDQTAEGSWYWQAGAQDAEIFWVGGYVAGWPQDGAFTNWKHGEPNNHGAGEHHANLYHDTGKWNDEGTNRRYSVIEWNAADVLGNYRFELVSDSSGAYSIDPNTGVLSVQDRTAIDFELQASHDISVQVSDAVDNTYTETFTVNIANSAAPVLTTPVAATLSYAENSGAIVLAPEIEVGDTDSINLQSAVIEIEGYVAGEDFLSFSGSAAGSWSLITGKLTITADQLVSDWQQILRSVTYQNVSDHPDPGERVISFVVNDGTENSNELTYTVSVSPINDSPVLGNSVLNSFDEDPDDPPSQQIGALFSGLFTDTDGNFAAIAVAENSEDDEGEWQYSTDNGSDWYPIDAVSQSDALLLSVDTMLRFVPALHYNGAVPALGVYAIDDSYSGSYTNGVVALRDDVSVRGGSTAFALDIARIDSTVLAVNDAPTLGDGELADIDEDALLPPGQSVVEIFDQQFSDSDGVFQGVAISADGTTTEGRWQYSTDNRLRWFDLGLVSENAALVLQFNAALRFLPAADYHGLAPALALYALDDTYAGQFSNDADQIKIDVSLRGGNTAIALSTSTIHSAIVAINDAPQLNDGVLADIDEDSSDPPGDTIDAIFSGQFTDVDGGMTGIAIGADATSVEGAWQYSTDAGVSWFELGAVAENASLVLADSSLLRFVAAENYSGAIPELDVYAVDNSYAGVLTDGVDRAVLDLSIRGGDTPYSMTAATIASTVTSIFDAPMNSGSLPIEVRVDEDRLTPIDFSSVVLDAADHDNDLTFRLSSANGGVLSAREDPALQFYTDDGALEITGSAAMLNSYLDGSAVAYRHGTENTNGDNSDSISVQLRYGSASDSLGVITVHIDAVNDAPHVVNNTITVTEDTAYSLIVADFGFSDPADGHGLQSVQILELPDSGQLWLASDAVILGQIISISDISDGKLSFEATANTSGINYTDFQFRLRDDGGTGNGGDDSSDTTGVITVDVIAVRDLPQLVASSVTLLKGGTIELNSLVLAAIDADVEAEQRIITVTSLPSGGDLELNGVVLAAGNTFSYADVKAGNLSYLHGGVNEFDDAITFSLADAGPDAAGSVSVTLAITVNETHPQPMGDSATVEEGLSVLIDVLSNDNIADEPLDLDSITIITEPDNGEVSIDGGGKINYHHDGSETTSDRFSYTVADSGADVSEPALVAIVINGRNDAPVLQEFSGPADVIDEDTLLQVSSAALALQLVHDDAEDGTLETFRVSSRLSGTLLIGSDQASAAPWVAGSNDTIDTLHSAWWLPATHVFGEMAAFAVHAVDSNGAESANEVIVEVTVEPVNDPPELGGYDSALVNTGEDTQIALSLADLLAQSADVEDGEVATLQVQSVLSGSMLIGATAESATPFVASSNHTVNAANSVFWTPAENTSGTIAAFSLRALDSEGAYSADRATVIASIAAVNDAPTLVAPTGVIDSVAEDTTLELQFSTLSVALGADDSDGSVQSLVVDRVDSGVLRLGADAESASLFVVGTNDTLNATTHAYWIGDQHAFAESTDAFTLYAVDDSGATSSLQTVVLQVHAVNDAPMAEAGVLSLQSDTVYIFEPDDFGFYDPVEGNALQTVRFDSLPDSGQLILQELPVLAGQEVARSQIAIGALQYTPTSNESAEITDTGFEFSVRDDGGTDLGGVDTSVASSTLQIQVTRVDQNTAPVVAQNLALSIAENSPTGTIIGHLDAIDSDPVFTHLDDGGFHSAAAPFADINRYMANGAVMGSQLGSWDVIEGSVDLRGDVWDRGPDGGRALDLNGSAAGAIEQQIATQAGNRYGLTFVLSGNFRDGASDGTVQIEVVAGDQTEVLEFTVFEGWSEQNPRWQQQAVKFTATGPVTSIVFRSLEAGAFGPMIADLQVQDQLQYQLLTPDTPFVVDADGAVLVVDTPLDHESQSEYTIDVEVSDADGQANQMSVPVQVLDLNESPAIQINTTLITTVESAVLIDASYLMAIDQDAEDQVADALTYTLITTPASGMLMLDNRVLGVGDSFTQADLNQQRLAFIPTGVSAADDSFSFSLADGGEDGAVIADAEFQISVFEPPTIQTQDSWALLEGQSQTLTPALLSTNGGYSTDSTLEFRVVQAPESAQFINQDTGLIVIAFSVQQLHNGVISLEHDGGERRLDEMRLSLYRTDTQSAVLIDERSIELAIANVADPPVGRDSALFTDHATPVIISAEQLGFDDGADGDHLKAIAIVATPASGVLYYGNAAVAAGAVINAAALQEEGVRYYPDPLTSGTHVDSIDFKVIDSGNLANGGSIEASVANTITVTVSSDHAPQAVDDNIRVDEGGMVTSLTSGAVRVTSNDIDLDTPPESLLVKLVGAPLQGSLELHVNGTFSYQHDGSETVQDSFSYRVVDAEPELEGEAGSLGLVEIEIVPRNDSPQAGVLGARLISANEPLLVALPNDLFTDADNTGALLLSATLVDGSALPSWLQFDSDTGIFSGEPGNTEVGSLDIQITATDHDGATASSLFRLDIEPQLDAAQGITDTSVPTFVEIPQSVAPVEPMFADVVATVTATDTDAADSNINSVTDKSVAESANFDTDLFAILNETVSRSVAAAFQDTVVQYNQTSIYRNEAAVTAVIKDPLETLHLERLFFVAGDTTTEFADSMLQKLNRDREDLTADVQKQQVAMGGVITITTGLSVGYVVWLVRGGLLIGSIMSSMPAWRWIDPLPVLGSPSAGTDQEDDESLESMVVPGESDSQADAEQPGAPHDPSQNGTTRRD